VRRDGTIAKDWCSRLGQGVTSSDRIIFTGNYETLEHAFVEEIGRLRRLDPLQPIIVVVISHLVSLYLARLLAERGIDHINIRFYTLDDLALEISRSLSKTDGYELIPDFADQAVINAVMDDLSQKSYFRSVAHFPGFSSVVLATIGDLKDACLEPSQVKSVATSLSGSLRRKVRDLAEIWKGYQKVLTAQGWFDLQDAMRLACEGAASWHELRKALRLLIYGFYDFNPLQRLLVESLMTSKPTTVFFPYEQDDTYSYALPARKWLVARGLKEVVLKPVRSDSHPQISHLKDNLFKPGKAFGGKEASVRLISAPGEASEVRETLRVLLNECLAKAIPLHATAILLRRTHPYAHLYSELLTTLGLEPYLPAAETLADTPAGRCALLSLEVLEHDYLREKVIELAKFVEPHIRVRTGGTSLWERVSLEAGIMRGKDEWIEHLTGLLDDQCPGTSTGSEEQAAIRDLLDFVRRLMDNLASVEKARTWSSNAQALVKLLRDFLGSPQDIDAETGLAEVTAQIEALGKLDGVSQPTSSRFKLAVEEILAASQIPRGRFGRTGPAIIGIMAARGLCFDAVVIPGLTDGYFPAHPSEDPILTDLDRIEINRTLTGSDTGPLVLKTTSRYDEERLLFKIAVSSAKQALIVSYPRLDPYSMRERLPSPFVYATIGAIEGRKPTPETLSTAANLIHIPLSKIAPDDPVWSLSRNEFETALALVSLSTSRVRALVDYLSTTSLPRSIEAESQRWETRSLTPYDGVLMSAAARQKLAANHSVGARAVAVTLLQDYARCPHFYFLKHILRIEPIPQPVDLTRIDRRLRGELLHSILYDFFTELAQKRGRPIRLKQSDWNLFESIALARFEQFEKTHPIGYRMIWELEKAQILEQLAVIFEETLLDDSYLPAYFELSWGYKDDTSQDETSFGEVSLRVGKQPLRLRGRIDRIDISEDGRLARIVDYKTGKARTKPDNFDGGRNLQLPLYIIAGDAFFRSKGEKTKVDHATYLHVLEVPSKRNVNFHALVLKERWNVLMKILQTIRDGIERGHFFQYPDYHCRYCEYEQICGDARFYLFERKQGDQRLAEFIRMRTEDFEDETSG